MFRADFLMYDERPSALSQFQSGSCDPFIIKIDCIVVNLLEPKLIYQLNSAVKNSLLNRKLFYPADFSYFLTQGLTPSSQCKCSTSTRQTIVHTLEH